VISRAQARITVLMALLFAAAALLIGQPVWAQKGRGVFKPIEDDPKLPRVLLIGDSISIGYTLHVRAMLEGKANVHRPPTNCGPTTRGLEQIDKWLGESEWDVIHFNWGLHDLKYINEKGGLVDVKEGTIQVPIDKYEQNLRTLIQKMKKTGANLIWCATTPVPKGAKGRNVGASVEYNAAAAKAMKDMNVATNDLYKLAYSRLKEIQRPANVHFTPDGSKILAQQVADTIEKALKGGDYEPTSSYTVQDIEGWKVYVHNDLLADGKLKDVGAGALKKLKYGLNYVTKMVADEPLKKLQAVKIWLEVDSTNGKHKRTSAYQYHPGIHWLKRMDFNPEKHKCVEFGNAASLSRRSDFKTIQVIMHELAHAYHDQVLSFENKDVLAAHKRAREEGKYPENDWVVRANHKEFFAGLTTRYFESQQRRKELVQRDPIMAKKLEQYYGKPKLLFDKAARK